MFDNGRRRRWSRVLELDPAARRIVWEYGRAPEQRFFSAKRGGSQKLANGNVLVAKWRKVPEEIARRVKGGQPGTERKGEMYGEAIQEIDRNGRVAWEWLTFEHLDPERDVIGRCTRATAGPT